MAHEHQQSQSKQAAIGAALASAGVVLSPASLAIGIASIAFASFYGNQVPIWISQIALAIQTSSMTLALGLSVRLRIDHYLFYHLSTQDDLDHFDETMVELKLMLPSKAGRQMSARLAVTLRLLLWQSGCLVLQLMVLGIWAALLLH